MLGQGDVLEGRYEVKGKLGEGGSSLVFLAYDTKSGENRAVKEIEGKRDGQARRAARREAGLVQRLRYPYFPKIEELIEKEDASYLVMEYLEGETLGRLLARKGAQPASDVVKWAESLCLMLGYLHEAQPPVLYRDMKPANVMLQSGGNLRLLDFGAAQEMGRGDGLSFGTRGYAAPEQLAGDGRTDVYGLGATMYQLLTGKDPGEFPCGKYGIRHWNRRLPAKLERIVKKCTRPEKEGRYPSCEALRAELGKLGRR